MKQRILALFLMGTMVIGMCGCGNESNNVTSSGSTNNSSMIAQTQIPTQSPDTTYEVVERDDGLQYIITDDGPGRPPEEDLVSSEDDVIDNMAAEPSGLILSWYVVMYPVGLVFPIYSLDPETGTLEEYTRFVFQSDTMEHQPDAITLPDGIISRRAIWFSHDYTKMAARHTDPGNLEVRAGWVDTDGNFFDVIAAVGEAHVGDFETPQKFNPIGFTEDDLFVYENVSTGERRYVDINNPTVSYEGDPFEGLYVTMRGVDCYFTGQINDTTYIIDTAKDGTQYYDISTEECTSYVVGDTRWNWNGRVSPDRSQIAFVSWLKNRARDVSVYIIQIDSNGNTEGYMPVEIPFTDPDVLAILDNYVLLGWR